jgi:hypothetical protein
VSAGHRHGHPVDAKELRVVRALIRDKAFRRALDRYTIDDNDHRIIYLAGSDNAGTTIFYDKDLPQTIRVARKSGGIKSVDPRPFLHWHEAVEGVLIRLHGFDYYKAHRWATAIERFEVERAGFVWSSYEKALRPFIHADEAEAVNDNCPRALLLEAYEGSKFYKPLLAMQAKKAA